MKVITMFKDDLVIKQLAEELNEHEKQVSERMKFLRKQANNLHKEVKKFIDPRWNKITKHVKENYGKEYAETGQLTITEEALIHGEEPSAFIDSIMSGLGKR